MLDKKSIQDGPREGEEKITEKKTLPETTTPSVHDKVWIKQYQKPWLL